MRLTKAQLAGIDAYKYSSVDLSITSRFLLAPFWNRLVKLFPRSVAPNTITFLGLCCVFINVATLVFLDPKYDGIDLGKWVYLSWAIGLFAYQSMDAIDGKQARKLGISSALGEMFDHGCDAINTTLEVALCAHALGLNRSWWTVASQFASLLNFYASTWEEYHTGTLYLSYFSGPVEGILLICGIYLISSFHPLHSEFWNLPMASLGGEYGLELAGAADKVLGLQGHWRLAEVPFNVGFMLFGAIGTVGNIVNSYWNVITARHKARKPILPPLLGLLPFITHSAILVLWLQAELRGGIPVVTDARFLPFLGYWGMSFSYQVSQLIVAHLTKSPFPYWNGMMVYSLFGMLDANAQWLFGRSPLVQSSPEAANVFICMSFFVALFNYIRYAREIIWQVCEHTGVACFTVRHKDEQGRWVANEPKKEK